MASCNFKCSFRLIVSVGLKGGRLSSGAFSHNVNVDLKLERDKFSRGVEWIHDLVYRVVFTQDRVRVIATKVENSIADMKRDGYTVAKAMLKLITFSDVSNMHWNTLLRQQTFLKASIYTLHVLILDFIRLFPSVSDQETQLS